MHVSLVHFFALWFLLRRDGRYPLPLPLSPLPVITRPRPAPIYRVPGEPFGLLGWQGIVPAKSAKMAGKMVDVPTPRCLVVGITHRPPLGQRLVARFPSDPHTTDLAPNQPYICAQTESTLERLAGH